jgi:hypothetical protein
VRQIHFVTLERKEERGDEKEYEQKLPQFMGYLLLRLTVVHLALARSRQDDCNRNAVAKQTDHRTVRTDRYCERWAGIPIPQHRQLWRSTSPMLDSAIKPNFAVSL